MRLFKLYENTDPILNKYKTQLDATIEILNHKGIHADPETLLLTVMDADPTKNYEYVGWLLKQVKFENIRLPEDTDQVKNTLREFHRIKRIKTIDIDRDINSYIKFSDLSIKVDEVLGKKSKRQITKELKLEGAEVSSSTPHYLIIKMLTPEASVQYAKNTRWCTSNLSYAKSYIANNNGLYIIFRKLEKGKLEKIAQFTGDFSQLMDLADRPITIDTELYNILRVRYCRTIASLTNLSKHLDRVSLNHLLHDEEFAELLHKKPQMIVSIAGVVRHRLIDHEPSVLSNFKYAVEYWKTLGRFEWPELETIIDHLPPSKLVDIADGIPLSQDKINEILLSNTDKAMEFYAKHSTSRSHITDKLVLSHPEFKRPGSNHYFIIEYITRFMRRPWRAAEDIILKTKNPHLILQYIEAFKRSKWREAEPILHNHPHLWNIYKFYK